VEWGPAWTVTGLKSAHAYFTLICRSYGAGRFLELVLTYKDLAPTEPDLRPSNRSKAHSATETFNVMRTGLAKHPQAPDTLHALALLA
jgi:hypothetical protein